MTENQRLFIETARALVDSINQAERSTLRTAPDATGLRLTELLDAASDHDDLFDMLGYGDAEALMLAAQKLAKRAAQRANADPWVNYPPYYTGKAEPDSISQEFVTYPSAQIIPMPSTNDIEPLLKIQALQDEIDQLRRDYDALLERVMEL